MTETVTRVLTCNLCGKVRSESCDVPAGVEPYRVARQDTLRWIIHGRADDELLFFEFSSGHICGRCVNALHVAVARAMKDIRGIE